MNPEKENESKSASRGQESSTGRGQSIANRAQDAADEARQATLERVESMRDTAQQARERAANGVRKFGGTVRKIGEHMRVEEQFYIAEKANDVSQRIEDVAAYLDEADLATLARDTRMLARKNPGWFYGGAFMLGLAAGRILKTGAEVVTTPSEDKATGASPRLPSGSRSASAPSEGARGNVQRGQDRPAAQSTSSARGTAPYRTGANQ